MRFAEFRTGSESAAPVVSVAVARVVSAREAAVVSPRAIVSARAATAASGGRVATSERGGALRPPPHPATSVASAAATASSEIFFEIISLRQRLDDAADLLGPPARHDERGVRHANDDEIGGAQDGRDPLLRVDDRSRRIENERGAAGAHVIGRRRQHAAERLPRAEVVPRKGGPDRDDSVALFHDAVVDRYRGSGRVIRGNRTRALAAGGI